MTKSAQQSVFDKTSMQAFLAGYYSQVDAEDLAEWSPEELRAAAVHHLEVGTKRTLDDSLVVLHDVVSERGRHTVIDIVTTDRKFLIDSLGIVLARRGLSTNLLVHPIEVVERTRVGTLVRFPEPSAKATRGNVVVVESWIHLEIDRVASPEDRLSLQREIEAALVQVEAIGDDDDAMHSMAVQIASTMRNAHAVATADEIEEATGLLSWLATESFQFLGYRQYRWQKDRKTNDGVLVAVPQTGLGLLRESLSNLNGHDLSEISADHQCHFADPDLLVVAKDGARSPIVRDEYIEYVGVKTYAKDGSVNGEHRFLGLFDASVFRRSVFDIPYLAAKANRVLSVSGLAASSHLGRELVDTLEAFPRDELFEVTASELLPIAVGITKLQEKKQVRVFGRRDPFGRFLSVLVYLPRERFSTTVAEGIVRVLMNLCGGDSYELTTRVTERINARVHVLLRLRDDAPAWVDDEVIEDQVGRVARWWIDDLEVLLNESFDDERSRQLLDAARGVFPVSYQEAYSPDVALADLLRLETLSEGQPLVTALVAPPSDSPEAGWRFRLYAFGPALTLSSILPLLENLGVEVIDEHPFKLAIEGGAWLHDVGLQPRPGASLQDPLVQAEFQAGFASLWRGEVDNDGLNQLILRAGMSGRDVVILRAYGQYLRQVGIPFTPAYVESTLLANASVAKLLVELFESLFDPGKPIDDVVVSSLRTQIVAALDAVSSLDEDRILRSFYSVITATQRTNAYRSWVVNSVPCSAALSFKLDPSAISELPLPLPKHEIWVYSPRVEGVHLRGGDIARGGLRWSDRRDDFRTEVLGLMKAQMVKNAVIVPVGAKGGFYPKRLPLDPAARRAEAIACYDSYISALLDVTDNIVRGHTIHPDGVRCLDGDDPYLVVAADKGTATFSDIANGVSARYGFWLGDAFASGGSVGYDHKKMGITARGAWESVSRHFRTLGVDVENEAFTVIGIGDMSGDVFGNGMLLSKHIQLVAAFDHRHIFLDPNPDAVSTFVERSRMFALPTSSWDDFDRELLSAGGGVWPRSAKSIPISEQVRDRLGLDSRQKSLTPNALINAILRAPVDLFWNGGIGTYVKASPEQHGDAGDRANDVIRVNGADLRCRVVGEGGNLGFTQRGRIEFALRGGLINTDAIDNSAGVDCSDHEVNIKISMNTLVESGALKAPARTKILARMTDSVGGLVLDDNRAQNLALAIARKQSAIMADVHARQIRAMELSGRINRDLEFLPNEKQLAERQANGIGLTTPEFAVILAYTKDAISDEVLASDLPDDPYMQSALRDYFPSLLAKQFPDAIASHPLRREIVTTVISNQMVNHAGMSFVHRLVEETGASIVDVVRAYVCVRDVFGAADQWEEIDSKTQGLSADDQLDVFLVLRRMVERCVLWMLRKRRAPINVAATIESMRVGVKELTLAFPDVVAGGLRDSIAEQVRVLKESGVPESLARRVPSWPYLHTAPDVVELATAHTRSAVQVAVIYWELFDRLDLSWLWDAVGRLPRTDRWHTQARGALRDELLQQLRVCTKTVLVSTLTSEEWLADNEVSVNRMLVMFADIRAQGILDLATLTVALRQLRNLGV